MPWFHTLGLASCGESPFGDTVSCLTYTASHLFVTNFSSSPGKNFTILFWSKVRMTLLSFSLSHQLSPPTVLAKTLKEEGFRVKHCSVKNRCTLSILEGIFIEWQIHILAREITRMLLVSKPYLENCILTSYDNSLKKKSMLILVLIPDVRKRTATLLPIVPCTSLSLYSTRS